MYDGLFDSYPEGFFKSTRRYGVDAVTVPGPNSADHKAAQGIDWEQQSLQSLM